MLHAEISRITGDPARLGGSQAFLYAGTEVAAREAERVARDVLAAETAESVAAGTA